MASPQVENGFLRLSNELAEALMKVPLNGSQWRIVMAVARECYGRNGGRKMSRLSLAQISQMTGLNPRGVRREVKELLRVNVLLREGGKGELCSHGLQTNYEAWMFGQGTQGQLSLGSTLPRVNSPGEHRASSPYEHRVSSPGHKKKEEKKKESFAFTGKHLRLTSTHLQAFKDAFPNLDIKAAIQKADAWCVANPDRGPRKRHARFVNAWLGRERPSNGTGSKEGSLTQEELHRLTEGKRERQSATA